MSGSVNPITSPQDWDVVQVGLVTSPGLAQLSGFKRAQEFDKKKGKGTVGGTLTFVQKPPVEGSIKLTLWLAAHFAAWDAFLPLLKYDPTKKAVKAIDVWHPSLADINATSFVCSEIGAIEPEGQLGYGVYSVSFSLIEFFPPPKVAAVSTPKTSTPIDTFVGPPPLTAADQQQAEIAALLAKATAP